MLHHEIASRRTNETLYFASAQIKQANKVALDHDSIEQKGIVSSHIEAAIFHLGAAYQWFLLEIIGNYRLNAVLSHSGFEFNSASKLVMFLEKRQITVPELNALLQVEQKDSSWLALLLNEFAWLHGIKVISMQKRDDDVAFNQQSKHLVLSSLEEWQQKLVALVTELRCLNEEW